MQLQENALFANRYELIKLLGRGGFSEVWLAKDNWTHLKIALKVYAPGQGMDANGLQEFCSELASVYDLNHSNLLKPQHVDTWENMPYLIMVYCSDGSCAGKVGQMSEDAMWKLIHDVAAGLAYLHSRDVVHQDIKPDNILVDDSGNYLITDFGVSTRARSTLRKSVISSTAGGTTAYMGPERFSRQPAPTKASDIWSFGAMCFELLEGEVPFGEIGGGMQKGGAEIPFIRAKVSDALKFTITKMLQKETWDRPTAETLVEWSQNPTAIVVDRTLIEGVDEDGKVSDTGMGGDTQRMGGNSGIGLETQRFKSVPQTDSDTHSTINHEGTLLKKGNAIEKSKKTGRWVPMASLALQVPIILGMFLGYNMNIYYFVLIISILTQFVFLEYVCYYTTLRTIKLTSYIVAIFGVISLISLISLVRGHDPDGYWCCLFIIASVAVWFSCRKYMTLDEEIESGLHLGPWYSYMIFLFFVCIFVLAGIKLYNYYYSDYGWAYQEWCEGISAESLGCYHYTEAKEHYQKLADKGIYSGFYGLATCNASEKKYDVAIAYIDEGILYYVNNGPSKYEWDCTINDLYDLKGEILLMQGKYEAAMRKNSGIEDDDRVYFKQGSDEIDANNEIKVQKAASKLQASSLTIEIVGYCDKTSSIEFMAMSQRRMDAVFDLLVCKYHVDKSRIITNFIEGANDISDNHCVKLNFCIEDKK